jgi:uncharacterized protein YcfL
MKKVLYLVCTALMLAVAPSAKAQFVVTDPANLASGIINSANEIVQTSSTVSNVKELQRSEESVRPGQGILRQAESHQQPCERCP